MKLRYVLVLAFSLVACLPLLLTLNYLDSYITSQYRARIENRLSEISLYHKNRLQKSINRLLASTALISSRTQMRMSLAKWNIRKGEADLEFIKRIITDAKSVIESVEDISIYDDEYRFVASTSGKMDKLDPEGISGNPYSIHINLRGESVYIAIVAPLILNRSMIGLLKVEYDISDIAEAAAKALGDTEQWLFAVRGNKELLIVTPSADGKGIGKRLKLSDIENNSPLMEATQGNELTLRWAIDHRGEAVVASTRYLSDLGWGVVVKINESEVVELIRREKGKLYLIEVMVVVFSIGFGVAVSLYVSRPIEGLIKYTEGSSRERPYEPKLPLGPSEVKVLSGKFKVLSKSIKKLDKENLALKEIASRDPLTGLHNRRFFEGRLNYEFSRAKRYNSSFILLLLDIDHFKSINDSKGHAAGDEALIGLSSFLQQSLRSSDVIARIGGEEFCIILPERLDQDVKRFIERLHRDIARLDFKYNEEVFHISCSMGVATLHPETRAPREILKRADEALYSAKRSGRNRIVYEESLATVVSIGGRKK